VTIPKGVRDAVVATYYPRSIAVADAVRSRAQSAYTISSAIGTVLLAAGVLSGIATKPLIVQILGLASLASWFLSALLFMRAVAEPVPLNVGPEQPTAEAFVNEKAPRASEKQHLGVRELVTRCARSRPHSRARPSRDQLSNTLPERPTRDRPRERESHAFFELCVRRDSRPPGT
jgi:hypothetical protein